MNIIYFLNEVLFAFLEGFIILLLFIFLMNDRKYIIQNKFKSLVFCLFYTVFSYYSRSYTPPGANSILHIIFIVLMLSFLTKSRALLSLIYIAEIFILIASVELGCIFIASTCFNTDIQDILTTPETKLISIIITESILLAVCYFLYRYDPKIPRFKALKSESSYSFAILHIFLMSLFLVAALNLAPKHFNFTTFCMLSIFIYFLSVIIGILDYSERLKFIKLQYKFQTQKDYVRHMESVIDIIRREKHQFINHLNAIYAMSSLGVPNLSSQINHYIESLTSTQSSSYQIYSTGNDYVNWFLTVKSNYAFENKIHLDAAFESPLDILDIDSSDLVSILGNILDNAVEAITGDQEHREGRIISILGYQENGRYLLSISNNGPAIPPDRTNKIFEDGYTTKTDSKTDHGYGLHIVKQLVKRNGGEITVASSPAEGTEFLISLPLRR